MVGQGLLQKLRASSTGALPRNRGVRTELSGKDVSMLEDENLDWVGLEPGSEIELPKLGLTVAVDWSGAPILTPEVLRHSLLRENFFPRLNGRKYEIPPCFSSNDFTPKIAEKFPDWRLLPKERKAIGFELMPFRQTRPDGFLRKSAIPHPWPHAQITKLFSENWHISEKLHQNEVSAIRPMVYSDGRIFSSSSYDEPQTVFERWWEGARWGSRFLLKLDIKSFFPSIYTHSLCWPTYTKRGSKIMSRSAGGQSGAEEFKSDFCNLLDMALMRQNQNQTLGIPVGPGTSNLVAEFLLLEVDKRIKQDFGVRFLRFVDDYYFAAASEEDAEQFRMLLEEELEKLELSLNPLKTSVTRVDRELRDSWLNDLRLLLATGIRSKLQLISYWDKVLRIHENSRNGAALRYGMRALLDQAQSAGLLPDAVGILVHQLATVPFLSPLLGRAIELGHRFSIEETDQLAAILKTKGKSLYTDSLTWIVFALLQAGVRTADLMRVLVDIEDPLVLSLAYGFLPDPDGDLKDWLEASRGGDALATDKWLLEYQMFRNGDGFPDGDGVFTILDEHGVDFVDRRTLDPF